jgi:NAD(P)-dependent dehydrogenase (short-subunit alcohol dehydrogenase family)
MKSHNDRFGRAIARRIGAGKHILLADLGKENAESTAKFLSDAGFEVSTTVVDVSLRKSVHALAETASSIGSITGIIPAAGVSPTQVSPITILQVDLVGTALVLEEFGNIIGHGGAGVVISSQSGHRLPALTPEQDRALATTPADDLLALPW